MVAPTYPPGWAHMARPRWVIRYLDLWERVKLRWSMASHLIIEEMSAISKMCSLMKDWEISFLETYRSTSTMRSWANRPRLGRTWSIIGRLSWGRSWLDATKINMRAALPQLMQHRETDGLISITLRVGQVLCKSKVERYSAVVLKVSFHQSILTKKDSLR